jgi:hypothetical protein
MKNCLLLLLLQAAAATDDLVHGLATKEGCRMERKSRNLEYAMGVGTTRFTT